MRITNNTGISLSMAVWLAHNEYSPGVNPNPNTEMISATTLLKPSRQFILGQRIPKEHQVMDVTEVVASRFGHAMHSSVENAWTVGYVEAMKQLGYPEKVIQSVRINPDVVEEGDFPVYLEQRGYNLFDGITITGQLDQIINGELNDTKTTSVYTYLYGTKLDDYQKQMSIYRWLFPDKVTSEIAKIQHVFTDWQRSGMAQNPDYPQSRVVEVPIELLSIKDTEDFIRGRLQEIRNNVTKKEADVIHCTEKELWMSPPVFKYYTDPEKAKLGGRATKNFDNLAEANQHLANRSKGVVITKISEPKACGYCPVFEICTQKDLYFT